MKISKKILTTIFPIFALVSCVSQQASNVSFDYTQVGEDIFKDRFLDHRQTIGSHKKEIDSQKILLLADNQKALITTEPVIEQSELAEKAVNTAHRRAALDAFSLDIVEYISTRDDFDLIIHGGDILNNSCQWEFKQVTDTLNKSNLPWFVAPGNHDGYFLGISSPRTISKGMFVPGNGPLDERGGWAQVCTSVKDKRDKHDRKSFRGNYEDYQPYVMDKVAYIGAYLSAIGVRKTIKDNPDFIQAQEKKYVPKGYEGYTVNCIDYKKSTGRLHRTFMSEVCWTEYEGNTDFFNEYYPDKAKFGFFSGSYKNQWEEKYPWRNFLVQKLELEYNGELTDVIIMDTSSYSPGHALKDSGWILDAKFGAADSAHISELQWSVINKMLRPDRDLILVGHHPLVDFDAKSYSYIKKLFEDHRAQRYISGDTHNGYEVCFKSNPVNAANTSMKKNCPEGYAILETNLGSTIDAPIEYAKAGFIQGEFVAQRFSLTPMKKLNNGQPTKKFKQSSKPKTSKHYALFDDELWNKTCPDEFGKYSPNDLGYNPFNGEEQSHLLRNLLNPIPTIKYVRYPKNAYFMDMYVYKINRLIWLTEIYTKLYAHEDTVLPDKIKDKIDIIREPLKQLYRNNDAWWGGLNKDNLYAVMEELSDLIEMFEEDLPNGEKASLFRQCSALYEAENEYKLSPF